MKSSTLLLLITTLLALLLLGCTNNTKEITANLQKLQSAPITVNTDKMAAYFDGDTITNPTFQSDAMKMVFYVDSTLCNSCNMKLLHEWQPTISQTKECNDNVDFFFIFSPSKKDIRTTKMTIKNSILENPIYLDTLGLFRKSNPHIPSNPNLHTFLLDKDNKVILVGNPLTNPKINEMFFKLIHSNSTTGHTHN